MLDFKYPVILSQTIFWCIFMAIDAYLLIPSIIARYVCRMSNNDVGRQRNKTVVIVGGSFSGLAALRDLQNKALFQVILIDQREYFEYTPGILRLFTEPQRIRQLAYPFPHGNHKIIHGSVTKTYDSEVTYVDAKTQQSQTIAFDYLIMATGSTYNYPVSASQSETTIQARALGWKAAARRLREVKSILVLGGGAVGTELAAEIADHYNRDNNQKKTITLVDACPKLVPMFAPEVSEYAAEWLKARGVTLVLGQMLEKWDTISCTLQNGQVLKADLVFVCFGDKPNSAPLVMKIDAITHGGSKAPPPVKLDRRKCVQTDAFLRVEGRRNVFSCGDVATPPTEGVKQAFHAEVQGRVAAENVIRLATGRRFIRYPEDAASGSHMLPLVFVLSLGKWDGVIGFNSLTVPGPLAALLKWILEWTKIRQMLGRPSGTLVWLIGDAVTFFISKNFLPPVQKKP